MLLPIHYDSSYNINKYHEQPREGYPGPEVAILSQDSSQEHQVVPVSCGQEGEGEETQAVQRRVPVRGERGADLEVFPRDRTVPLGGHPGDQEDGLRTDDVIRYISNIRCMTQKKLKFICGRG